MSQTPNFRIKSYNTGSESALVASIGVNCSMSWAVRYVINVKPLAVGEKS